MLYIVVVGESASDLTDNVNARIAEGYRLQGGVSVCVIRSVIDGYTVDEYTFAQAMTIGDAN